MLAIQHRSVCWLSGMVVLWALQTAARAEDSATKEKEAEKTAFLNIRVVDEKGQPQTETMVHILLRRGRESLIGGKPGTMYGAYKCDEQGWVAVGPFEPGEGYCCYVVSQKERYAGQRKVLDKLQLKPGRNEQVLTYTTSFGRSISGVLLDKAGRPLDGITVRFAPHGWCGKQIPPCGGMRVKPTCTTSARGEFSFEGLEGDGDWAVVAVDGLKILYLCGPLKVPVAGRLDVGQLKTDIDRNDVKVGPN